MRDYEANLLKKIEARRIPDKIPQWQKIFMKNGSTINFVGKCDQDEMVKFADFFVSIILDPDQRLMTSRLIKLCRAIENSLNHALDT